MDVLAKAARDSQSTERNVLFHRSQQFSIGHKSGRFNGSHVHFAIFPLRSHPNLLPCRVCSWSHSELARLTLIRRLDTGSECQKFRPPLSSSFVALSRHTFSWFLKFVLERTSFARPCSSMSRKTPRVTIPSQQPALQIALFASTLLMSHNVRLAAHVEMSTRWRNFVLAQSRRMKYRVGRRFREKWRWFCTRDR